MVILEIFHRHARSRTRARRSRSRAWATWRRACAKRPSSAGPKDRERSGIGGRSGGESHGELDRRKIRDRIAELQKELDAMGAERKTQRARRQERQGLARVALVGYTNAGKSTLMRALTGKRGAGRRQALRDARYHGARPASRDRPARARQRHGRLHQEPAARAGRVVQVDARRGARGVAARSTWSMRAIAGFERQLAVTEEVLDEIGAKDVPRLLVFNKIDRGGDEAALRAKLPRLHRDERAPRGRRREAARGDRRVLPAATSSRPSSSFPGRRRSCAARSSPPATVLEERAGTRARFSASAASSNT